MGLNKAKFPAETWDGLSRNTERVSIHNNLSPNVEDWDQIVAEVREIEDCIRTPSEDGWTVGSGLTLDVAGVFPARMLQATIGFNNVSLTMTDAGAAGSHGTKQIFTFPTGLLFIVGTVAKLSLQKGSGGITVPAMIYSALGTGTINTDNSTLTGAEADFVPSYESGWAPGEDTGFFTSASATTLIKDGVLVGAPRMHLNVTVPTAYSAGNDTLLINGYVVTTWINCGTYLVNML